MGQYCFARRCMSDVVCRRRLSASVVVPVGGPRRRSAGRHCTAGKYGYVPLGRHLVLDMTEKLEIGR